MRDQIKQNTAIPATPSDEAYGVGEDQGDVFTQNDPVILFDQWFALARQHEMNDPNAMALATIDSDGLPDVRIVLLKDFDHRGLSFYTNTQSAKGEALAANPVAALCFHWKSIRRQVRFRGPIEPVSGAEADAYFATRARGSQIGAWGSDQSRALDDRETLTRKIAEFENKFDGGEVPRPPHWSGYRLKPLTVEFWVNRPYRLHDRLRFVRTSSEQMAWATERLYP